MGMMALLHLHQPPVLGGAAGCCTPSTHRCQLAHAYAPGPSQGCRMHGTGRPAHGAAAAGLRQAHDPGTCVNHTPRLSDVAAWSANHSPAGEAESLGCSPGRLQRSPRPLQPGRKCTFAQPGSLSPINPAARELELFSALSQTRPPLPPGPPRPPPTKSQMR
ncbi:hypothetical protein GGR56DRAFT_155888 [Xylariaceae sp. FL0804]|nr:hypothetical protein GGR56DRAFT_155888 [Xylariaceae sp. FL0804]